MEKIKNIRKKLRHQRSVRRRKLGLSTPTQIICVSILLLLFAFVPQFGLEGVWISVFTAISAFCNAGFDLFGRFGAYSSLVPYVNNYYVQAVIIFMIISGGLGFMVWVELCQWYQKRRLSLHAKVVLSFSVILWLGGALGLGLMEWNNPATLGGLSVPGKVMASLFQSVSTRHEHRGPGLLRHPEQAAHERAAIHRRSARLYRRRREGDHLRCHHPDHPQRGAGTR